MAGIRVLSREGIGMPGFDVNPILIRTGCIGMPGFDVNLILIKTGCIGIPGPCAIPMLTMNCVQSCSSNSKLPWHPPMPWKKVLHPANPNYKHPDAYFHCLQALFIGMNFHISIPMPTLLEMISKGIGMPSF